MRSKIVFFSAFLLITILYVVGCRRAGAWLVKDDNPVHGDAMILLMGGISDRVLQAADLYNAGRAGRLIIVQENMGASKTLEARGIELISNSDQIQNAAIKLGIPPDSITVLPGDAQSTLPEVIKAREYLEADASIDTLIIVTSPTHTRRASIFFKTAFKNAGPQICVLCSPSTYSHFDARHWWRGREEIQ